MKPGTAKMILASASPRRVELLKQIVAEFDVLPSPVKEVMNPRLGPLENAVALAGQKALWAAEQQPGNWVLGADTLVALDDRIIGKPAGREEACRILQQLCGREHEVITGVALVPPREHGARCGTGGTLASPCLTGAEISRVTFKPVTGEEIARYVDTGEPMDKAGAYAIQGQGSFLVERYEGSYSNIVGLPLEQVRALLGWAGWRFP